MALYFGTAISVGSTGHLVLFKVSERRSSVVYKKQIVMNPAKGIDCLVKNMIITILTWYVGSANRGGIDLLLDLIKSAVY